jgi:hypothetical protein
MNIDGEIADLPPQTRGETDEIESTKQMIIHLAQKLPTIDLLQLLGSLSVEHLSNSGIARH